MKTTITQNACGTNKHSHSVSRMTHISVNTCEYFALVVPSIAYPSSHMA